MQKHRRQRAFATKFHKMREAEKTKLFIWIFKKSSAFVSRKGALNGKNLKSISVSFNVKYFAFRLCLCKRIFAKYFTFRLDARRDEVYGRKV